MPASSMITHNQTYMKPSGHDLQLAAHSPSGGVSTKPNGGVVSIPVPGMGAVKTRQARVGRQMVDRQITQHVREIV